MTTAEIRERIEKIKAIAWDDEKAHSLEDELLWEFVEFIALRTDEVGRMASILQELKYVYFARWTA